MKTPEPPVAPVGVHLHFQGREPVGGNATIVCDARSLRHRQYCLVTETHICEHLSRVALERAAAGSGTYNILIASPAPEPLRRRATLLP